MQLSRAYLLQLGERWRSRFTRRFWHTNQQGCKDEAFLDFPVTGDIYVLNTPELLSVLL